MSEILKKIGEIEVSTDDLIKDLKLALELEPIARRIAAKHLIRQTAEKKGIKVSDEELQQEADNFRKHYRLFKASDMNKFLDMTGLSLEDFEWEIETMLLYRKLKEHLFADKVENYFIENKLIFDEIEIRHIVVRGENTAQEIFEQVKDDSSAFAKLAKKYSIDTTTSKMGGYVGWVRRGINTAEIEAKIFNGKVGEVFGPFKVQNGFEIILIEDKHTPEKLDEQLREEILETLFQTEFLQKHLPAQKI